MLYAVKHLCKFIILRCNEERLFFGGGGGGRELIKWSRTEVFASKTDKIGKQEKGLLIVSG